MGNGIHARVLWERGGEAPIPAHDVFDTQGGLIDAWLMPGRQADPRAEGNTRMKPLILAATCAACLISGDSAIATTDLQMRMEIIDAITDIAAGADRHDWIRVRSAFADQVTLDYTSLWGGEPTTQAAEDIVAQWSAFLPGFDATLHLVTNHTIVEATENFAVAEADFHALHRIDDAEWILSGRYTYQFIADADGWKVRGLSMQWTHESGDRNLVSAAAERARSGK